MTRLAFERASVLRGRREVLRAVSAAIAPGAVTAVIGPNGAGKSTLLAVAAGLLAPTEGRVLLDDAPLESRSRRDLARIRAYLPQDARVDWPITVEQAVALGLGPALPALGPASPVQQERIDATLAQYDLDPLRRRPATALSGGERARVMLARASVAAPSLLIADEPTAGLDPRHALDAGARLRAMAAAGCTVLVALHDLDLMLRIADRVLALRDGRLLAHGPAETVLTPPLLAGLYDVTARVVRDEQGASVRFLG